MITVIRNNSEDRSDAKLDQNRFDSVPHVPIHRGTDVVKPNQISCRHGSLQSCRSMFRKQEQAWSISPRVQAKPKPNFHSGFRMSHYIADTERYGFLYLLSRQYPEPGTLYYIGQRTCRKVVP